jgi:hypothetical protein
MTQRRWLCRSCDREWVFAAEWTPDAGCPICHAATIEQVLYTPIFPGADIPRMPPAAQLVVAPLIVTPQPVPLPLYDDAELYAAPV